MGTSMDFAELLSYTFEYGTGISIAEAVQSERFKEIEKLIGKGEFVGADDKALMLYLGELLVERATQNMPFDMKLNAIVMKELSPGEQERLLERSVHSFAISRRDVDQFKGKEQPYAALPHQMTLWELEKRKPNCLGVAQMLVGFARMAGMSCALADTISRYDVQYNYDMYRSFAKLHVMLERHSVIPAVRRVARSCKMMARECMQKIRYFEQYNQSHHALIIKLSDGDGRVLFDPYMSKSASLEADTAVWHKNEYPEVIEERIVETYGAEVPTSFDSLSELLSIYEDFFDMSYRHFDYQAFSDLVRVYRELMNTQHEKVRDAYKNLKIHEDTKEFVEPVTYIALLRKVYEPFFGSTAEEGQLSDEQFLKALPAVLHARRTKRERNQAFNRFIQVILDDEIGVMQALYNPEKMHPCIEVGHPEYHIAIMTLNHVACLTGSDNTPLLKFEPFSQAVIHDTISAVRQGGDEFLNRLLDATFEKLSAFPDYAIEQELLPHLKKRREADA